MALPRGQAARMFYRAAKQRLADAQFLLEGRRYTASVYLVGYGIECMLKALLLEMVPDRAVATIIGTFRGARAHNFGWLRQQYLTRGGHPFPAMIARAFARANSWDTRLRYRPGEIMPRDAESFMVAARAIMDWIDMRL